VYRDTQLHLAAATERCSLVDCLTPWTILAAMPAGTLPSGLSGCRGVDRQASRLESLRVTEQSWAPSSGIENACSHGCPQKGASALD
jgi:hypothetical protein